MAEFHNPVSLFGEPTLPVHAANIQWVKDYLNSKIKEPVRLAVTTPLTGTYSSGAGDDPGTFTLTATGALMVDGKAVVSGDRLIIIAQVDGRENGIYVVVEPGSPTAVAELVRASDFYKSEQISTGVRVTVADGLKHSGCIFSLETAGTIILDSTSLDFHETHSTPGVAKFVADLTGDGTSDEFIIQHDLCSDDVVAHFRNTSNNEVAYVDYRTDGLNAIIVSFDEPPPSTLSLKVIVLA